MDFHYTVETNKSIDEAIHSLELNLKEKQFGILWQFDITSKLQEKGIEEFNTPYRVLEVCNPFEAANVLKRNALAGYFLPCKIIVYQIGDKTNIGFPKPTALISMLNDVELKEIANRIENTLINVLEKSK
ncbi:MAG: DUF302 domain-containing protein [Paenibacillaceae bacterium]